METGSPAIDIMPDSRVWAEISYEALAHNLQVARDRFRYQGNEGKSCQIMAVVKAGAYGHGLVSVGQWFESKGVDFLGVANVKEARLLEASGVKTPKYLLGITLASERLEIVENRWVPCVASYQEAQSFSDLNQSLGREEPLNVHLAVDTGMGRGGYLPSQLKAEIESLKSLPGILIKGVASHLPSADEDEAFTIKQHEVFDGLVEELGGRSQFESIHIANSAGLLGYQSEQANLARPGLMLYGVSPLPEFQEKLKRTLALKARVTLVRELPAGHGVSYGRTYVTEKPTLVATVGAGYGDGYPRLSRGGRYVWLNGQRCPVLGRVTMDQFMIDVSDIPETKAGDVVELFGDHIPILEVAEDAQTIPWEILTRITSRVDRVYR